MTAAEHIDSVLMARQPIFDRDLRVVAYELLFRQDTGDSANVADGDLSSSQVILNAFTHFGLEEVVGRHIAYVNFTRHLLENPPIFAKSRMMIEILETEIVDEELIRIVKDLQGQGYNIALDDFALQPGWEPLLELASVVKVDVMDPAVDLEDLTLQLREYPCKLLAEKVEDAAMYEHCRDLGYELFQGYFLSRPQIMEGRQISASKLLVMETLGALQRPDLDTEQLEQLVVRDPVLVHKLLSLVNSTAYVTRDKIESISWAITYLGLNTIRSLASLLSLSNLQEKPVALRAQALQRAKMCELIGRAIAPAQQASLFSVGLLSLLDAFFDQTLEQVLSKLALSEEITLALLEHEGLAGRVLQAVLAHESGHWEQLNWSELRTLGISEALLASSYQQAIAWIDSNSAGL